MDRYRGTVPRQVVVALFLVYVGVAVVLLVIAVAARILDQPHGLFVLESAEYYPNVVWYSAFLSTLGVLLWWTSAAACLVAGTVLRLRGEVMAMPFFVAGLFTALLVLDDAFLVHDILFEMIFGIDDLYVFGVYAFLFLLFLVVFRNFVRASPWPVLALAGVLFGASIVIDALDPASGEPDFLEEGLEFLGIATWSTFFVWLSVARLVGDRVERPTSRSSVEQPH